MANLCDIQTDHFAQTFQKSSRNKINNASKKSGVETSNLTEM
jgi:hypothetical protein